MASTVVTMSDAATTTAAIVTGVIRSRAPTGMCSRRETATAISATAGVNSKSHAHAGSMVAPTHGTEKGASGSRGHPCGPWPAVVSSMRMAAVAAAAAMPAIQRRMRRVGRPVGHPSRAMASAGRNTSTVNIRTQPQWFVQYWPTNQTPRATPASHSHRPVGFRGARHQSHRPPSWASTTLAQPAPKKAHSAPVHPAGVG